MESLQNQICKMKCVLITPYRSGFIFFVKAVAKLSDFTVEKGFKAIRNVLSKYDVVFFDFTFGQTASSK